MDVDNDIDSQLLQQFSSMGTTDREVLISQFQNLLAPNQLNAAACAFFLDMNNWNLQAAICSYYDYEQPSVKVPQMAFVQDITIGEGESVPPNTDFIKTWRIKNCGDESWPPACSLKYVSGDQFGHTDRVLVDMLPPGGVTDVSIEMKSPEKTGYYQGQWRMCTPTGMSFGEVIWVILQVDESGLLGVTQQLSQVATGFSHEPQQNPFGNPFGTPNLLASPSPSLITHPGSMPSTPDSEHRTADRDVPVNSNLRLALFQENSDPDTCMRLSVPDPCSVAIAHTSNASSHQDTDSVDMT
eukprot:GHVO01007335.1.p1 GENE.GHVO01007335.1~~GHVO01007335.1.p1  ORF type:complete len:298 (+),score=18.35 GHVO01007335.1:93-986(+)